MAKPLGNNIYQITSIDDKPASENWQFSKGDVVRCVEKTLSDNQTHLVAVEAVEAS